MRALILSGLLLAGPGIAGTPLPDAPHIVSQGEGTAKAKPDQAKITVSAQYRNASAAAAKRSVDRAVDALLKAAPSFALTGEDITASDLSVSEDIDVDERDRPVSNGFVAERSVIVTLRAIDRLSEFLDAALEAGLTQVDGVTFESSREAALRRDARDRAITEAREKAEGLAVAFGRRLGPVYSINSLGSGMTDG